jgi:hypothetical protein
MRGRKVRSCAAGFLLLCSAFAAAQERFPWGPQVRCTLNKARPGGLHPDALSALTRLTLAHRITQGINHSADRGNVHGTDVTIEGAVYTAAVDISVRCLTEAQIRTLLASLANAGFAGWFRKDGADGWSGPNHIHAIWTGSPLKPVLLRQVESWLEGRNGLGPNNPYRFWQPDMNMAQKIREAYRRFN